jgi:signal-transduction protein with cAMP-binding, CBS, and nucleotidyltransferase domain
MKISELPKLKDLKVIAVRPDVPVINVTRHMAKFNIGVVIVVDDQGEIAGVLSERDIVWCLGAEDTPIEKAVVGDLMTKKVVTISPEDSLVDAVIAMNANGIRHLVVAEDNKPVEIISIRDVLQAFAQQQLEGDGPSDGRFARQFVEALASAA